MDIFDFAMNMEKEGEKFYRELAQKSSDKGLEAIFNLLADDEVKHYETFQKMKNEEVTEIAGTQILQNAKSIFTQIKEESLQVNPDINQVDLYKKAQKVEKENEDFYRQKAEEVGDEKHKNILLMIADEEKKHYHLLQNIIEFVARPQQWIEDAEFYHLEEY